MENSFIEILKKRLLQDSVIITYKIGTDILYERCFIKAENENFYNWKRHHNFYFGINMSNNQAFIKNYESIKYLNKASFFTDSLLKNPSLPGRIMMKYLSVCFLSDSNLSKS